MKSSLLDQRKRRPLKALLGAFFCLAICAAAENNSGKPAFSPFRKGVLENGLLWIYQQDLSSDCTSAVILIKGGKSAEPAGMSGLAYLATRLAVEIPDDAKLKELMIQATQLSVRSREDHSWIGIQCLSRNFSGAMDLIGKLVRDPLLSRIRISAVKEWMLHRGKEVSDDSVQAGHDIIAAQLFGPAGRGGPSWGTESSLKAIHKNHVEAFHDHFFRGSQMVVSVVSDLGEKEVVDAIRKSFSGLSRGEDFTSAGPSVPRDQANKTFRIKKDSRQTYVGLGWVVPAASRSSYALAVLAEDILGGGVGSKLWALRENRSLAYNINASLAWTAEGGFIEAYLEASPFKAEDAGLAMKTIVNRLGESGISEEELTVAKRNAATSFFRTVETKEIRASTWAVFETRGYGDLPGEAFLADLERVSIDEMNSFLKSVFAPEAGCEVVIGPENGPGE